ncbi:hypothetical protein EGW08_016826 [Elysia chlorotica]|uniref:Dynein heavy chain tail domain-containing protein n=1 Tax=Elysia chlorotica TaxID=188477 RepID=A0A3S1HAI1_ELYCH|nr:hypothetical protein EGW08_016826 [Elysia chlorotica]
MDDFRFEWIRDRVYLGLGLRKASIFENFLEFQESELSQFLNKTFKALEESNPILFYKEISDAKRSSVAASEDPDADAEADDEATAGADSTSNLPALSSAVDVSNIPNITVSATDQPATGQEEGVDGQAQGSVTGLLSPHIRGHSVSESQSDEVEKPVVKVVTLHMVWGNLPEDVANSGAQSVFFTRVACEMVPVFESKLEAIKDMPNHVEYGILNGNALKMLERTLTLLYHPLLVYNQYRGADSVDDRLYEAAAENVSREGSEVWKRLSADKGTAPIKASPKPSIDMEINVMRTSQTSEQLKGMKKGPRPEGHTAAGFARDEFLIGMQKFMQSIEKKLQEIQGSLKFVMPEVNLTMVPDVDLRDQATMKIVNESVQSFQYQIDALLEETLSLPREGEGPLAEIKYWKERDRILSGVVDQLHDPKIKYILDLHLHTEMDFELTRKDLLKYAVEAHDNVRFLSTLERHFRNIKYGATFQTVTESLAPMILRYAYYT